MVADLASSTYFVGHPLWHQQEWIKNGACSFSCDFTPMIDSEMVFVNGIALSKHRDQSYSIQNKVLQISPTCDVREGDVIKIVYAWR